MEQKLCSKVNSDTGNTLVITMFQKNIIITEEAAIIAKKQARKVRQNCSNFIILKNKDK